MKLRPASESTSVLSPIAMSVADNSQELPSDMPNSVSYIALTEEISIRPFELEDQDGVFRVIRDANYNNFFLAFYANATGTMFQILTVAIAALSFYALKSIVWSLVAVTSCFGLLMVLHIVGSLYYLYGSPLADVRNVKNVYFEEDDCHFWVAEAMSSTVARRRIVGTIAIVRRYDRSGKVAWLRRMAVLKKFRKKGIAKKLIETTLQFCKNRDYTAVQLQTTSIHQTARSLYMKLGFECINYRPTPYLFLQGLVHIPMYEFEFKFDQTMSTGFDAAEVQQHTP